MKTTKRFENAVMKLYKAFHENRLNATDCTACAVGNICDNSDDWKNNFGHALCLDYNNGLILKLEEYPKTKTAYFKNGYNQDELHNVEKVFLNYWLNKPHSSGKTDKDLQFKGLCAVVEYLAELDNIPNPMDYSRLFETQNDKPIYELKEVF
jgi:hypothetical protein